MGEHVAFLSIRQQAFIMNNKGYPVLSAAHEQVIREFMRRHVNLALHHDQLSTCQQKQPYFKYLAFVLQKFVKSVSFNLSSFPKETFRPKHQWTTYRFLYSHTSITWRPKSTIFSNSTQSSIMNTNWLFARHSKPSRKTALQSVTTWDRVRA